jgi:two-component system response regulator FixJ
MVNRAHPESDASKVAPLKVYVVDDNDSVRRALSRLFRSDGISVEEFDSGAAFLARLPELAGGCLLVDIQMPGLTGFDVQNCLRAKASSIPVITLSAHDDSEAQEHAKSLGAIAFVRKPMDSEELLAVVRRAMCALG